VDLDAIVRRLRAAGCVFAEDEARLLTDEAVGPAELEAFVARRVAGEPLEYIVGWAEFAGLRVSVAPGVFVPRLRTTALVHEALRVLARASASSGAAGAAVLDLCCGAGAIGAAILASRPDVAVYACDIDAVATQCARRTLDAVVGKYTHDTPPGSAHGTLRESAYGTSAATVPGPAGDTRGFARTTPPQVFTGDLYSPLPMDLRGRVDLIVANAPYVPTDEIRFMPPEARDHERAAALDGGADGLELQRRVVDGAREWLAPGGHVLIETGRGQASGTAGILEAAGFSAAIVLDDEVDGTVAVGSLR
jgi:release factor glutamine methyltransferase